MLRKVVSLFAVMVVMLGCLSFPANAKEVITYALVGDEYAVVKKCDLSANGDIVIADEYKGLPVTRIESSAFYLCGTIETITMPDTITYIGQRAFSLCRNLKEIKLSAALKEIDEFAFAYCSNLLSVTVPDMTKSIGKSAFSNCERLESVIVPASVTTLGDDVFSFCSSLTLSVRYGTAAYTYAEENSIEYTAGGLWANFTNTDAPTFINKKVWPFTNYKKHPLQLTLESSEDVLSIDWSSSDKSVKVDKNGLCTPTKNRTCSAEITATLYGKDEESIKIHITVNFYKYPWHKMR